MCLLQTKGIKKMKFPTVAKGVTVQKDRNGILSLTDVATLTILLFIPPYETAQLTRVDKGWLNCIENSVYWQEVLKQFYAFDATGAFARVKADEKCSSKEIYKTQVLILKKYIEFSEGSPVDLLRYIYYRSIFSFEPIIKAVARKLINFGDALKLTAEQVQLIKKEQYPLTAIIASEGFRVTALLKGISQQVAWDVRFTEADYEKIPVGWMSEAKLGALTLEQIKKSGRHDFLKLDEGKPVKTSQEQVVLSTNSAGFKLTLAANKNNLQPVNCDRINKK